MNKNRKLHVGLDVSLAETHICILDEKGKTVCETVTVTDPDAVSKALEPFAEGIIRVGLEASSIAGWLHRELADMGYPMILAEAYHMRTSLNAQRNSETGKQTWIGPMFAGRTIVLTPWGSPR